MSETFWHRLVRGERRIRERADWLPFAGEDWVERIMSEEVTDRFHAKQGRSIARWTLQTEGRQLVVYLKRHYRLPWWQGLLATLHPGGSWSPAMQEWEHLTWAREQGFPVPSPAAAGEYIGPWGRLQSFLAVEELTDMLPLHQAIPAAASALDAHTFLHWKRTLIAEMVRIVRALHNRSWFHKDLYLCHFYIHVADTRCLPEWKGRVQLIDLHRLGRHRWLSWWWQAKDLAQLLYSSAVPGVTARDRVWFWRLYRQGWSRWTETWIRRMATLKAWNYERHNRKKRLWKQLKTEQISERSAA